MIRPRLIITLLLSIMTHIVYYVIIVYNFYCNNKTLDHCLQKKRKGKEMEKNNKKWWHHVILIDIGGVVMETTWSHAGALV